ncbi:MAG: hypothetical protein ACLUR5_12625 [Eubacterium ventriosum]
MYEWQEVIYKKVGMINNKERKKQRQCLITKVFDCGYDMNSIFHGYDILAIFKGQEKDSRSNAVGVKHK